jgi:hypothetical protein
MTDGTIPGRPPSPRVGSRAGAPTRVRPRVSVAAAGGLALLGLAACASEAEPPNRPPDAGAIGAVCDADACADRDMLDGLPRGMEGITGPPDLSEADLSAVTRDAIATCYDGADNDDTGASDCADEGCARLRSCCLVVARAACCEPRDPWRPLAPPAGCLPSETTVAGCLGPSAARAFGDAPLLRRAPETGDDAVTPSPGSRADVGVILDPVVRPRGLSLTAQVALPGACGAPCNDYLGVGLLDQRVEPGAFVRPAVGAVVALGRAEAQLVVDGEVAERLPLAASAGGDSPATVTLALAIDAAGRVSLRVDDGRGSSRSTGGVLGAAVSGTAPLEVAVWGRGSVPTPADAIALRGLEVQESVCETPAVWTRRTDPVAVPGGGAVAAPSLAFDGSTPLVAYERDGAVRLARATGGEALTLTETGASLPGLRDPDLVVTAPGEVELYAADPRTGCIARARGTADVLEVDAPRLLCPGGEGVPFTAFDGPSVLLRGGRLGEDLLFVRAAGDEGEAVIVVVPLPREPTVWTGGIEPYALVVEPSDSVARFDADEVAAPAAVRVDGAVQVWYAGRTGSRWSIGMIASDAALEGLWRSVPDAVVRGSGQPRRFDSLSVRAPALARGPDGVVHLLYEGNDGLTTRIGHATRLTTRR